MTEIESPAPDITDTRSMFKILDLQNYEHNEAGHPGYGRNINEIVKELHKLRKEVRRKSGEPFTILEAGPGPGTVLTRRLGAEFADRGSRVIASEYDPQSVEIIRERQKQGDLSSRIDVLPPGDTNAWMREEIKHGRTHSLDAIVSNFAMHHFSPEELKEFFRNAGEMLKPGGRIITGEEFLDPALQGAHESTASKGSERAAIQVAYHGERVIVPTWNEGKVILPGLEFQALVSGLKTTAGFFPDEPAANGNNKDAVALLGKIITEMKSKKRFGKSREKSDNFDPEVGRERLLASLEHLKGALASSPVPGLAPDAVTLNPQTGLEENIPGIDRKITAKQFAEIGAEEGFSARITFTGAHQGNKKFADVHAGKNPEGGVAVVTSGMLR